MCPQALSYPSQRTSCSPHSSCCIAPSGQTCSFWRVRPAHQPAHGCRPQPPPVGWRNARSATFDPCAARGGAVALTGRDWRLSVPPFFPRSVWERTFYAVLELSAAVLACGRDGLDLGVLPPVTIFARPYRFPASGFRRYSIVGKPSLDRGFCNLARGVQISANMLNHLPAHHKKKRSLPIQGLLVACR